MSDLRPTQDFVEGSVADGAYEAFQRALDELCRTFDVQRMVLSYEGGQDGFVQSGYVYIGNPRQIAKSLRAHADSIENSTVARVMHATETARQRPDDA